MKLFLLLIFWAIVLTDFEIQFQARYSTLESLF